MKKDFVRLERLEKALNLNLRLRSGNPALFIYIVTNIFIYTLSGYALYAKTSAMQHHNPLCSLYILYINLTRIN